MCRLSVVLLILSTVCSGVSAADSNWPGWLGPNRDGRIDDFSVPEKWPDTLARVWRVEVGTGYSSPIVDGHRVYQQARQKNEEILWCVDLETGNQIWRRSHPVPFQMGGGGERHGKGPKSSPVLADGRIYTMSITGTLSAWNADTGESLWMQNGDAEFEKSHPYWGAATSPIVDGDHVIVHFGTDDHGALVALDVASGNAVWSLGDDGPSYSSPLIAEFQGVRQIVEWTHEALIGVDSQSGQLLWRYPFPHEGPNQNMPTPTIHDGRVYLGGENRGLHCLQPRLDGDSWTVKKLWDQERVALDMSSAVLNGKRLYGFSHYRSGCLFCIDIQTGRIISQGEGRTGDNVMFLSIPGHVVALVNTGELRIIRTDRDDLKPVASWQVAESETWAPPVLLDESILIKDHDQLTLWSLSTAVDVVRE